MTETVARGSTLFTVKTVSHNRVTPVRRSCILNSAAMQPKAFHPVSQRCRLSAPDLHSLTQYTDVLVLVIAFLNVYAYGTIQKATCQV